MIRPAPLAVLAAAVLSGCGSQYRVDLWNDTGHAMDVGIIERWSSMTRTDRHATVAPGGWFDYSVDNGKPPWPKRAARLHVRDVDATIDLDLTGVQIVRARVLLTGTRVGVEPITPKQSEERRRRN